MSSTSHAASPPRLLVVAAVLARSGELLLTQRRPDQAHPLAWELPGGKVEIGEAPPAALARELREELGATVEVGPIWEVVHHIYPAAEVVLLVYPCRLLDPALAAVEVAAFRWWPPEALGGLELVPADVRIIARLRAEGLPTYLAPV